MAILDITIVNVALPTLATSSVVVGFLDSLAVIIPAPGGSVTDSGPHPSSCSRSCCSPAYQPYAAWRTTCRSR
ncbi:MAG: hypothetical protein ACRDTZ_14540 [Pseudonocardiaceae bacterium]